MADDQIKNWGEWNRKWQRTITAQSPFEWHFAIDVIQKVSGLGPNNVTPQQSFIANDGRERHMDFAIEIDGVKIAIEVEGWDKTGESRGKNKQEHDEFNRRIQSLTSQGWRVLTVTNAQFKRDPIQYIADINKILFEEQTKLQSGPSTTTKKSGQTPNEERNVKPPYALMGLAAIAVLGVVIGVVIWALTRDSETVDTLETDKREDASTPEYPSAEEFQEMYILKDGGNVHSRIDFEAVKDELQCPSLGNDQKPVFLPDPEKDFFNFDGDDNGWGCTNGFPAPDYFTKNFEENGNSWHFQFVDEDGKPIDLTDENVQISCDNVREELKPIHLPDVKKDPYGLDGDDDKKGCESTNN
tara:strand:+ start:125 stop:1192 length:1068 start_codon:yes stop_codon:yes gene_type:complete